MPPPPPNLFAFAAKELSQDAILAWLLSWASSAYSEAPLHKPSRQFVAELLHHTGVLDGSGVERIADITDIAVQSDKIDIQARITLEDDTKASLIIENKTETSHHSDQLQRYAAKTRKRRPDDFLAGLYIKTGLVTDRDRRLPAPFKLIDRAQLLAMLYRCYEGVLNPILAEYLTYLESVEGRVQRICADVWEPSRCEAALQDACGQWHLMERIFRPDSEVKGHLYRSANVGGAPWTQFAFCELHHRLGWERLFWRIDVRHIRRKGPKMPYLALRQYERHDKSPERRKTKLARLSVLRRIFDRTFAQVSQSEGWRIQTGKVTTDRTGNRESEVGVFFIDSDRGDNLPDMLTEEIPVLHAVFIEKLMEAEWGNNVEHVKVKHLL